MQQLIPQNSTIDFYAGVEITDGQEVIFQTRAQQNTYFQSKKQFTVNGCSYLGHERTISVQKSTGEISKCNFLAFRNPSFENIVFFARIMDWQYINNAATEITYAIDWFQTFFDKVTYEACEVVREHVTEAAWENAVNNPFRNDIPELLTPESMPMERQLEAPRVYDGDFKFFSPYDESEPDLNLPYAVLFLAPFDFEQFPDIVSQFFDCFTFKAEGTGGVTTEPGKWFNVLSEGFVRPFAVLGLPVTQALFQANLNKAISWLTANGLDSEIIGWYIMPKWALTFIKGRGRFVWSLKAEDTDPKLQRYPYQFLRVTMPDGSAKEYWPELFHNLAEGSRYATFDVVGNFNGVPEIAVLPINYQIISGEPDGKVANYFERIDWAAFPQMGYSSDAFLTYLSGVYSSAMSKNTFADKADRVLGMVSNVAGTVGSVFGGAGDVSKAAASGASSAGALGAVAAAGAAGLSAVPNTISAVSSGLNTGIAQVQQAMVQKSAGDWREKSASDIAAIGSGDSPVSVFDAVRPAYVGDVYHAGSGSGYLPYEYYGPVPVFERVSLNPTVKESYSRYLALYGWNCGRVKVPNVVRLIKEGVEPHFEVVDNKKGTYCQTANMKITGVTGAPAEYIRTLFNAGCRFIDGRG